MAEPKQKAPSTHTDLNNPDTISPPKRKPPKIRRNFSPVTESTGKDDNSPVTGSVGKGDESPVTESIGKGESDDDSPVTESVGKDDESNRDPDTGQVSRDTDGDTTSVGHESSVNDEYISEPESFTSENEPQAAPQRAEQPSARETAVIDRPKTAPDENWQRRVRGKRGNQQLVPIDDVGKTVNSAVGTVHDVGSKALSSAGNTAGKALGDAVGVSQGEQKGKEEQLRLRLDLNLDIEVQLKAKIHGDLTLQLLS